MPRRKQPAIPDELLDQLLAGSDPRAALTEGGLLDGLKKALAERALNAELDHHWRPASRTGAPTVGMATAPRACSPTPPSSTFRSHATDCRPSIRSSSPSTSGASPASTIRSCRCTPAA